MAGWRKVLVSNTKGTAGVDLENLGHIVPDDLAINEDGSFLSGVASQALSINDSGNGLEWKDVTTTFASLTDSDTTSTGLADNDIMVYDTQDSKYKMMPMVGDVKVAVTGSGASTVATMSIQPDSVALGTDTTGNYVLKGETTGNGISGSINAEGGTFTVTSNAVSTATANTLVYRDASGDFIANEITASLDGTAAIATAVNLSGATGQGNNDKLVFAANGTATGTATLETDVALHYNPNTQLFTAPNFAGDINGTIGATAPTSGAFTNLTSSGNTSLTTANITGNLSHTGGTATLAGGSLVVSNEIANAVINTFILNNSQTGTWPLADPAPTAQISFDILQSSQITATDIDDDDFIWVKAQNYDESNEAISGSYSYVKLRATDDYDMVATVGTNLTTTWDVIDWPDGAKIIKGPVSIAYSSEPTGTQTITMDDTVIFTGGGTFASTSNFATTDNLIHLNVLADNSAYGGDLSSGIVFGTTAADEGESATAYKTGGKLIHTDTEFIFGTFADVVSSTPANQDNLTTTNLKDIRVKAIQFDTSDTIDETGNSYANGDNPYLGVNDSGVLYFYMAE
jgi:hypothetical protein